MNRRMLICVFIGFSSGLPFFVLFQQIPAWLRDEGVALKDIGFFSLVGLPYVWKFLWAPFLDRYTLSSWGKRRSWMLTTQVALFIFIASIGLTSPQENMILPIVGNVDQLELALYLALAVGFFSATQDIALDAYRRELLLDRELGFGNSLHVNAYRIAGLIPGSLAFVLADYMTWNFVFLIVACFMLVGIVVTACISEVNVESNEKQMHVLFWAPLKDFYDKRGGLASIQCLLFLVLYKLGDNMAVALSTPFYLDSGFSLTQIGLIAKHAALWPSIVGGIVGGLTIYRIGINASLFWFGWVQLISILGFVFLANSPPKEWLLALVVAGEYFGVGLGTAALTAYVAREATPAFAASQIAIFTALAAVPRTLASVLTGYLVDGKQENIEYTGFDLSILNFLTGLGMPEDGFGWSSFFILCTVSALPGMLLAWVLYSSKEAEKSIK